MNHPVAPPAKLLDHWYLQHHQEGRDFNEILIEAAQWGADAELDRCCELFESNSVCGTKFQRRSSVKTLRAKRRPQPEQISVTLSVTGTEQELKQLLHEFQRGQRISLTVQ